MILQNLLLCPSINGFASPRSNMYYHGQAIETRQNRSLLVAPGHELSFETFFNSFQIKCWKKCSSIKSLYLMLAGEGQVIVRFARQKLYQSEVWLQEETLTLTPDGVRIAIPAYTDLQDGLLYFTLTALTKTKLSSGYYATDDPAVNDVKLGMCITHFNRQKFVISAAKRLTSEILEDPAYKGISLVIVDNSQNLKQEDVGEKTILVPNRNTGGSGGFTRGLLELKDRGYTHCLFMDDDAGCEAESIKRVFAFYSYYDGNEHIGISGILLQGLNPWLVHEAGGYFRKGRAHALNSGMDTTFVPSLLVIDQLNSKANYGAWCFFAFRIADIKHLAFPFFVRGDDILFSQHNELSIMTMMGVSTWIDSFLNKDGIQTRYLSSRSYSTLAIILKQATWHSIYRCFRDDSRSVLYRLQYAQARGIYKGLYDLMTRGTKLYSEDPDGARFRSEIKQIFNEEKYQAIDERKQFNYVMPRFDEDRLHRLFRHLTINGLLIPQIFFKHRVFWNKSIYVSLRGIYRFREVFYFNDEQDTYSIARHDKLKIIGGLCRNFKAIYLILKNYKRVQRDFDEHADYLTSEEYWRKVLGMNENKDKEENNG